MSRWISIMGGLLLLQLVLAAAVNLTGEDYGAFKAEEKLMVFDPQKVDGIRIEEAENRLVLKKRDGQWLLPDSGDFAADQESVDRLLARLGAMEKGWPVATTGGAIRRFKVAEEQFERKLALLSNKKTLAELYVGSSPGFRKVHVRPAGEQAVFAADFSTWEASAKTEDWIDKTILELDENDVAQVEMPGYVLQRNEGNLKMVGLIEPEETNAEAAGMLMKKLTGLRIQSLLGTEEKPEYRQQAPALEVSVTRKGGDVLSYRFSKPEEGSYYVLKRSDLDPYFKVPEFAVTPIKDATRDKLVQVKTQAPSTESPAARADNKEAESMQ